MHVSDLLCDGFAVSHWVARQPQVTDGSKRVSSSRPVP